MINITIVGMTGTGKSSFIKHFIKNRRAFVFDVQNEYQYLNNNRIVDLDEKNFIKLCMIKRNTVCVFEEATAFVIGNILRPMRKMLVSKRHTGNTNILVFHTILSIPPFVLSLSDIIIMFKTNDEDYQVENKFPSLMKYFIEVKNNKNNHYFKIIRK